MRTHFDPEEAEEFEAAKDLLIRRCLSWADEQGVRAEEVMLSAALDSRHRSRDGRLAYWDRGQVRRFLLEWAPRYVVADQDILGTAPETLRTLLRYLAASGLRDPRGATLAELETAVAEAETDYPAALADPLRQGLAKFWAQTALDQGVDLTSPKALAKFQRDVDAGRIPYDAELVNQLVMAQFTAPGPDEERAFSQPPLILPPPAELAEAASRSETVRRLAVLADWVGADGRPLTTAGNLRLADARELAALLGTGEQELKARSSTELRQVHLLLTWAKKARLIRLSKGRLFRTAKAVPLLRDPEALWRRAFETYFDLGLTIGAPAASWIEVSMLAEMFEEVLPDALNSVYGMPSPMPMARLQESVWLACLEYFPFDLDEDDLQQQHWRQEVDQDLVTAFEVLADLGAVELSHGLADELYSSDLDDEEQPLPPEACARLLPLLAEPGQLVHLTPLGLRAVRERMLAEGRDVPLVGELADASPAELLGVLAQHYTPETGTAELEGWLAAHGEDFGMLLDAVRASPFRTRAAAMLNILAQSRADGGQAMLLGLRHDPALGPLAVTALLDDGTLAPRDLTADEQLLLMTEGLLALLELGGPEDVIEQVTAMTGKDALHLIEQVLNSGHPAEVPMAELRTLVAEPLRSRTHRLRRVPTPAPGSRGRRNKRRKP